MVSTGTDPPLWDRPLVVPEESVTCALAVAPLSGSAHTQYVPVSGSDMFNEPPTSGVIEPKKYPDLRSLGL
jgi:hypothetical protein